MFADGARPQDASAGGVVLASRGNGRALWPKAQPRNYRREHLGKAGVFTQIASPRPKRARSKRIFRGRNGSLLGAFCDCPADLFAFRGSKNLVVSFQRVCRSFTLECLFTRPRLLLPLPFPIRRLFATRNELRPLKETDAVLTAGGMTSENCLRFQ